MEPRTTQQWHTRTKSRMKWMMMWTSCWALLFVKHSGYMMLRYWPGLIPVKDNNSEVLRALLSNSRVLEWSIHDQCRNRLELPSEIAELHSRAPCRYSDVLPLFLSYPLQDRLERLGVMWRLISTSPPISIKSYFLPLTPQSSLHLLGSDWGMSLLFIHFLYGT